MVAYVVEVAVVLVYLLVAGARRYELLYSWPLVLGAVGLVYALWIAWIFRTIVAVAGIGDGLYPGIVGWTLVIYGTMFLLLVAPPTWRYARRVRPQFLRRRS